MPPPLALFQHPTVTYLIDDSPVFLQSLAFQLDRRIVSRSFHDTSLALRTLLAFHDAGASSPPLRINYDEQMMSLERCTIAVDIDHLYRQARNARRFDTPSVLVIDYAMPQMNGLEFCEAVRHLPCKKILFTGEGDERVAVEAFNKGLIDRYIRKGDDDALDTLEVEVLALQQQYFAAQADTMQRLLQVHNFGFFSDPAVALLAEELSVRFNFVEHYLFPNPSGILFLTHDGTAMLLVIETETSLISHFEVARDNGAPPELLACLVQCQIVPFFYQSDGMYTQSLGGDWRAYCQPAQAWHGRQTYYWALFDLPSKYLQGPLFSYAQYMREKAASVA
ncbi:MAG TPA: response regulator [Burkholderiaceae bacterium]